MPETGRLRNIRRGFGDSQTQEPGASIFAACGNVEKGRDKSTVGTWLDLSNPSPQ